MLDFSSLPMGATLLAPAHLHPLIRQKLLQTTHGLLGLRLYTLNGYLSAQSLEDAPSEASILSVSYTHLICLSRAYQTAFFFLTYLSRSCSHFCFLKGMYAVP